MALHRTGEAVQNAFAESFIGRLRDELLNEALFRSLPRARAALDAWRSDYNHDRPHSRLGRLSPATYAAQRRSAALRTTDGSGPRTAATTAQQGITADSNRRWIKIGATSLASKAASLASLLIIWSVTTPSERAARGPAPDRGAFAS
jgi:hypothetical protein